MINLGCHVRASVCGAMIVAWEVLNFPLEFDIYDCKMLIFIGSQGALR